MPWEREKAIKDFYEGRLPAVPETTPDYVFVGRSERAAYPGLVVQPTWQLVVQDAQHALYRLPAPARPAGGGQTGLPPK